MTFLKDRVMAEQVAKDSMEAMLQGDLDYIRAELGMATVEHNFIKLWLKVLP